MIWLVISVRECDLICNGCVMSLKYEIMQYAGKEDSLSKLSRDT